MTAMNHGKRLRVMGLTGLAILAGIILARYRPLQNQFVSKATKEFAQQPLADEVILTESDVVHLPAPVRRYLAYTGSMGKPRLQNAESSTMMIRGFGGESHLLKTLLTPQGL